MSLVIAQLLCAAGYPAQPVLDLTKRGPGNAARIKCFGGIGEGEDHATRPPRRPALPIEVTIQTIWPYAVSSADPVNLEILIRNISKEPILVPASTSDAEVLRTGNLDQRILVVGLTLTRKGGQSLDITMGTAVGSGSVTDSMISLAPQEALPIRVAGPPSDTWKWNEAGLETDTVEAQAFVGEQYVGFENGCLYVKQIAPRALSANRMEVVWKR